MRTTESKYIVMKKMIWNGKMYHVGDVVVLPAWAAEKFYYAGVVSDDLPRTRKSKLIHPLDKRVML